jgi:nicotinate dehydrogenase subunit A
VYVQLRADELLKEEFVMAKISLKVNGKAQAVDVDPSTPLLYVLRDDLGLKGPRFGCGLSQCGCCTVIVDGNAVRSCSMAVSSAKNRNITTLEGLGSVAHPHPLQKAFIDEQAAQCGYCMNGMIMNAKVLLDKNPRPTEGQIRQALDGILCRCGSHLRILRAIQRATV